MQIEQQPSRTDAATRAERLWCAGDVFAAMELADRALAADADPAGHAAAVAAAASAADGTLHDAARRWRAVSAAAGGDLRATGRAALAAALTGDATAAGADLAAARRLLPDPAPRAHGMLVGAVAAVVDALHGDLDGAARRLTGLATASVAPDLLAVERCDELAACVLAVAGNGRAARALLERPASPTTARRPLLAAWLDLRAGRVSAAREALTAAAATPVLRRDAVLAAAVSAGVARRSGVERALTGTWHRAAPVVAGADVEILLLDAWGELSVAAAIADPGEQHAVAEAMATAVARAGAPWWAVAADRWWQVQRAAVADDPAAARSAAVTLADIGADRAGVRPLADAAAAWAAALHGAAAPDAVAAAVAHLAGTGLRFEAERLCAVAAERAGDPDAARTMLGAGRRLRDRPAAAAPSAPDALSPREREVGALVVEGLTHKEIGRSLYISPKTVEQHVARMRQKLAASTRADLVAALRARL